MSNPPRILLWDIESSLNRGYFFSLFKEITTPDVISHERHIISIAYKWLGDKKGKVLSIADFPGYAKDPRSDKELLKAFAPIWEQADYAIAHYGDGFDVKFVQGRCLLNGLPPMAIVPTIDTYKLAKRHFLLNSNKLDYLAKQLGLEGKHKMGMSDWIKIEEGSLISRMAAVKKMANYNLNDVDVLEAVWKILQPYVQSKINMNLFSNKEKHVCSSCGSDRIQKRGRVANKVTIYQRLFCKACRGWSMAKMEKE